MTEPVDIPAALRALQARDFLSSAKYSELQTRARTEGAHPHIIRFSRLFVKRMADRFSVPVYAHTMRRTMQEQWDLLNRGVSRDSPADGLWPHQWHAVDLVHGILHWEIPKKAWDIFGHVGKELASSEGIDIVWGGDWKFYDPAHWEIRGWKNQSPEDFPPQELGPREATRAARDKAIQNVERSERYLYPDRFGQEGGGKKEE